MRLRAKRMMRRWCGVESAPYHLQVLRKIRSLWTGAPLVVCHCGEGDVFEMEYEVCDVCNV